MDSAVFPVDQYNYSGKEARLFDTNVWLLIFGPQYSANDPRTVRYSLGFKRILAAKASIFIDALILSEFIDGSGKKDSGIDQIFKQMPPGTEVRSI
ncbi:MAG: hypothetical protein M1511_18500 [Deltaproteobacteria bacterium]|nr:hypothetical protein [Deltaproteobacteria bacterium]